MAGWTVAEVGRQPWIVWGLMKTTDAVSPVPASSVALSLLAFLGIYGILGLLDIWLLQKYARLGPPATPAPVAGSDSGPGGRSFDGPNGGAGGTPAPESTGEANAENPARTIS